MVSHRQLAIGLVLFCANFVEVVAESVDETCAQDVQEQISQGEALLQVDSTRAATHQQQQHHHKANMGPQGLKLLSQGHSPHDKSVHLTTKGKHAATPHEDSVKAFVDSYDLDHTTRPTLGSYEAEKAVKHTSKKNAGNDNNGFDFGGNDEEKPAKKKKPEGKMVKPTTVRVEGAPKHKKGGHYDEKGKLAKAEEKYDEKDEKPEAGAGSGQLADEESQNFEDSENTDEKKTDKHQEKEVVQKNGHGGQKGKIAKSSLLVVDKGEKAKKGDDKAKHDKHKVEKGRQQPDEEEAENNDDDVIPPMPEKKTKEDDEELKKDEKKKDKVHDGQKRKHKHKHDNGKGGDDEYEYEYEYKAR